MRPNKSPLLSKETRSMITRVIIALLLATSVALGQIDSIQHGGLERTFLMHLPPSYDGSNISLVVAMHGGFGSAEQFETSSRLSLKADASGFAVVYPEGARSRIGIRTWNAGGCCGFASDNQIDDVGFISVLLDTLLAKYAIDPQRVFATGMSNGGMMAYRLACELSDRIAAIAPVAATLAATDCEPARAMPTIHLHSFLDTNVPYDGGLGSGPSGFDHPSLDSVFTAWANHNGCASLADTVHNDTDYVQLKWPGCDAAADLELYLTHDGGHSWPGGQRGFIGADPPSEVIDANELMWEFFKTHPLPGEPTNVKAPAGASPDGFAIIGTYPNPFNPSTTIEYELRKNVRIQLAVYNTRGQQVALLFDGERPRGKYSAVWQASGKASGVYLIQLTAGDVVAARQVILLR